MSKMKKIVSALLIVVCAFSLLAGCSENKVNTVNEMYGDIPNEYKVGDTPVDFKVELLDGDSIKLSDLKGKYTLLNFWFIDCPPCVAELPAFERLSEEYKDEFEFLTINVGDKKEDIEAFMKENDYSFKVGVDKNAVIKFPSNGLPYTLILDKEGVIVDMELGGSEDESAMYNQYKQVLQDAIDGIISEKIITGNIS